METSYDNFQQIFSRGRVHNTRMPCLRILRKHHDLLSLALKQREMLPSNNH